MFKKMVCVIRWVNFLFSVLVLFKEEISGVVEVVILSRDGSKIVFSFIFRFFLCIFVGLNFFK